MNLIQIGANSGNDAVNDFIKENQSLIHLAILVEPMPFVLNDLNLRYQFIDNVVIESIAIVDNESENTLTLYYEDNSINYEVCSFSKKHLLDHGCPESKIKSIDVDAMTVNKLMEKYNLTEIDHLFIDTEGLDAHIIASLDFTKYIFKNITFEVAHTDGANTRGSNFSQITEYLRSLGYTLTIIDHLNMKASL
jgi:FkbM family methyltransferase